VSCTYHHYLLASTSSLTNYSLGSQRSRTSASANLRVSRKQDVIREVTSPDSTSLTKSIVDLLPSTATNIPILTTPRDEADILYSFDKKASPSDSIGLGGLVEKAEQRFREKETVKLIKEEYEVLDEDGEGVVLREKSGKKTSPKVKAKVEKPLDNEDDDYELV